MSETNTKKPLGMKESVMGVSMEFETVPPQKNSTKAQKSKTPVNWLQPGDDYFSIKASENSIEQGR